jgi:predicted alpha-1,2-mannosidase
MYALSMMSRIILLLLSINCSLHVFAQNDIASRVNPFIGTGGHGHTYPGAVCPFGMVQLSPDTRLDGWDGCSGYHYSDSVIYGFSHTHLSGTGVADLCDLLLYPSSADRIEKSPMPFLKGSEVAKPGYYKVDLVNPSVSAEFTVTERTGMHRYTFNGVGKPRLVLDLLHRDKVIKNQVYRISDTRFAGMRCSDSWAKNQKLFFVIEFSEKGAYEIRSSRTSSGDTLFSHLVLDFAPGVDRKIEVRVALSSVSVEGAIRNLEAENSGKSFEMLRRLANQAWNKELSKIEITGGAPQALTVFYTALYHTMVVPSVWSDVDGQYRGMDDKIHIAKGYKHYQTFSLWDTFRACHPLYTLIDSARTRDFIHTFLNQYRQGGRLPVWELTANETDCMIGYHSVSVMADALCKNINDFDVKLAYEAAKASALRNDPGLNAYRSKGYIGMDDDHESVSKTLEYAYDKWCVARIAAAAGDKSGERLFDSLSGFWRNVFDPSTGFMRPRKNGNWYSPFDPREVNNMFTEANAWQYSFFVPHDIKGLVSALRGPEAFCKKLDELFSESSATTGRTQADITGLIGQYAHGNEPSHHMAYLYAYAGKPWKTQERVRTILDSLYAPMPDGLAGNEDCGQMSAWYVLSAMGLYPVCPGQPEYVIGTPLFPSVSVRQENGRSINILARGVSAANKYVSSTWINGQRSLSIYISHNTLRAGGEIMHTMAARPLIEYKQKPDDLPPSLTVKTDFIPAPVIQHAGKSFRDTCTVKIMPLSGKTIFYTTDGSDPSQRGLLYPGVLKIERSTEVKACYKDAYGRSGPVETASLVKAPNNYGINIKSQYNRQYSAGGDKGLIDGIFGDVNWRKGEWQGYQGQDFECELDMLQEQEPKRVRVRFLQDTGPWILFPKEVSLEISEDGRNWSSAGSIKNTVPPEEQKAMIKEFDFPLNNVKARWLRVKALSGGNLPAWHPGAGFPSFIFIDEISVEVQ